MPRFVVLHHETPPTAERPSHWDLMLEEDDSLATWALERLPAAVNDPAGGNVGPCFALALPAHRLDYLTYEGEISGGRGGVQRWDQGIYELLDRHEGSVSVRLMGRRLVGVLTLAQEGTSQRWKVIFKAD